MFDWLRELAWDWRFMRGKASWPGIEQEFDVARRKVATLDGKKPTKLRVYRKVRERRKAEAR